MKRVSKDYWTTTSLHVSFLISIVLVTLASLIVFPSNARSQGDVATRDASNIVRMTTAIARLTPSGGETEEARITLPFRWDKHFPHRPGVATFTIVMPSATSNEPHALYFRRVGNQAEIRVNGVIVRRLGQLDNPAQNYARGPVLIQLAPTALGSAPTFDLTVTISAQSGRWGGVPAVVFGPLRLVEPMYLSRYHWRQTASLLILLGLTLMGLVALALWARQREPLFGLFTLIAAFGSLKVIDRVIVSDPLPWPAWGAVVASAYALHVVAAILFALAICGWRWRRLWPLLALASVLIVPATVVSFVAGIPQIWTYTLISLVVPSVWAWVVLAKKAIIGHSREAWLLLIASSMVIAAGIRDLVVVRVMASGIEKFSVMPIALFMFIVFMAWIIIERFTEAVSRERSLNATLGQRIAAKEDELNESYREIEKHNREQATLQERQRIMRDIHDGVGAHLVGLLNLANMPESSNPQIAEQSQLALDELRMAIDSLQPVDGDLNIVLATLRYRMLPRLEEAGLKIHWEVDELPSHRNLTPTVILNIQRILLEAFANVVRHANASNVTVSTRHREESNLIEIAIHDDGVGLPSLSDHGQGFRNMRTRANAIGATIAISDNADGGTSVLLTLDEQR